MKFIISTILILSIVSCAGKPPAQSETRASFPDGTAMRYLAWLEGDYQNSYRANRTTVRKRLSELKGVKPSDTDKYLEYLSLLDAAGRVKEAGFKIKAFLSANPKETRAAFLLGVHHLRKKQYDAAKYFFERLEKDNRFQWPSLALNNLGMMALNEGKRYRAISYFERAANAKPLIAAPHVNLGSLYLQSRSFADAERAFYMAYKLDGHFEDAALGRGIALEGMGQFSKAHEAYARFLKKNPNSLSVLYNDSILLGKRLNNTALASEQLLRYIQKGGKETAKAQKLIQNWR